MSGRFAPPARAVLLPAALFFANSSSCFASSAFRSKKELELTPAALALFDGAISPDGLNQYVDGCRLSGTLSVTLSGISSHIDCSRHHVIDVTSR